MMQSNKNYAENVDNNGANTNIDMNHFVENEAEFFTSVFQDSYPHDNDVEEEPVYVRSDHTEGIWIDRKDKKRRLVINRLQQIKRRRLTTR